MKISPRAITSKVTIVDLVVDEEDVSVNEDELIATVVVSSCKMMCVESTTIARNQYDLDNRGFLCYH